MDPFYRAFEERHRGSRESIESRLEVYLPFVEPLKKLSEVPEILDLGCGRGEWLELLQNNGFHAKGVDLDEGMLLACRELDLDVLRADALDYLRGLAADSLSVVSAFHVVEHISFKVLRQLVDEAHRVLKPGGLLILETPNSENLVVGTSSFYMDPTHQRPLPALLLGFVVEYAGFARVKTLYLQESPELVTAQRTSLFNVLDGVSPDYAIVAQKKATAEVFSLFDEPFGRSYGMRLDILATRYDQQAEIRAIQVEARTAQLEDRAAQLESRTVQLEARATQAEARAIQADARTAEAQMLIQELLLSSSWRITKPMRGLKGVKIACVDSVKHIVSGTKKVQAAVVPSAVVPSIDIENLLSSIREELGAKPLQSAMQDIKVGKEKQASHLGRIWHRLPPNIKVLIRRFPFFPYINQTPGKKSETRKAAK